MINIIASIFVALLFIIFILNLIQEWRKRF
jgi:hypothetical protein